MRPDTLSRHNSTGAMSNGNNEEYGVLTDCVYGGLRAAAANTQLPADDCLGRRRQLRALLDSAMA